MGIPVGEPIIGQCLPIKRMSAWHTTHGGVIVILRRGGERSPARLSYRGRGYYRGRHDSSIIRFAISTLKITLQTELFSFWDMRWRHAIISPGFSGHYQDLGIKLSSRKRHDSACTLSLILSVRTHEEASSPAP